MIARDMHFQTNWGCKVDVDSYKEDILLPWLTATFFKCFLFITFFFSDGLYKQSELGGLNRASQQSYLHPEKHWWDVIAVTVLKQGGLPHNHIIFHKTRLPLPGTLPCRRLRGRDMRKMPDQTAPITRFPLADYICRSAPEWPELTGRDSDTGAVQPQVGDSKWDTGME